MWITQDKTDAVDKVARVFLIQWSDAERWNRNRKNGEPRVMCGWVWSAKFAKNGHHEQAGFKTMTAAYIDCWYHLVQHQVPPSLSQPKIRLVSSGNRRVA